MKENNSKKAFFPAIDIARFFLSIFVLYSHTVIISPYNRFRYLGPYAVVFFFAISAFLLARLAMQEYKSLGTFHVKAFYYRRILRIWPAYFLFIFIVLALLLAKGLLKVHLDELLLSAVFLGNLKNSLYPFFFHSGGSEYFSILWSLGIEEQFYLFFPLFILPVLRNSKTKNVLVVFSLILICSLCRGFVVYAAVESGFGQLKWPGFFFQTTSYLDLIFLGMLAGIYRDDILTLLQAKLKIYRYNVSAAMFVLITWVVLLEVGQFGTPEEYRYKYVLWYPFTGLVTALFVVLLSNITASRNLLIKTLAYLGKLSYGIYLFHMPIYLALRASKVIQGNSMLMFPIVAALTIFFSHWVYKYYEKYFREISRRKFSIMK